MSDVALYRKYRSADFDAVIGQGHVISTLQSAIAADRLSHAYLFTGPRGVGKTSVARLLARAANCTAKNPSQRPCGTCEMCKIEIGSHMDLIEIDAASNRGIDDARDLRDKITSAPSLGRYKVYIIDEVHMLTPEAFNALLKTLEEPPAHAMFILATTEAQKLPDTIVSRTQRFSFKPIGQSDIVAHLQAIAKQEKIEIDDAAVALIAHASRGGFRDAISLLDQASGSGEALTAASVRRLLGHGDPELLTAITLALRQQQPAAIIEAVQSSLSQGIQPAQLASQLIEHWRVELHQLLKAKQDDQVPGIISAIEALLPVGKSSWPELALEAALVRAAMGSSQSAARAAPAQTATAPLPAKRPAPVATSAGVPTATTQPDKDLWLKTLSQIKQKNNSLYALLRSSTTPHFEGNDLMIGCNFSFHRDRLKEEKNMVVIEQALARVYGRKVRVVPEIQSRQPVAASPSSELVSSALEILGGEVIDG